MKQPSNKDDFATNAYIAFGFLALISHLGAAMTVGGWLGTWLAILGVTTLMIMQDAATRIKSDE